MLWLGNENELLGQTAWTNIKDTGKDVQRKGYAPDAASPQHHIRYANTTLSTRVNVEQPQGVDELKILAALKIVDVFQESRA